MVDPYAFETYEGREGETFAIEFSDGLVDATLRSVETHRTGNGFTLTFTAVGAARPQATYIVRHADMGELVLFLVPVGAAGDDVEYEAVFTFPPATAP